MNKERVVSSIPRAAGAEENVESACPYHKADKESSASGGNWVYPSPQMFWDAMRRKGSLPEHLKDSSSPQAQSELDWIVTIHNVVNEQCWQEICKWERFNVEGCRKQSVPNPTVSQLTGKLALQRFLGRPNDLSPRAWFNSVILGTKKPFDRHDWYVRLPDGSLRRYVIDFYSAKEVGSAGAFHLDVRPAVDSVDSALLRIRRFFCKSQK